MANSFARELRRKMTDAEMRLWFHLRPLRRAGLTFRRQSPVGRYILDFECRPARLGIELDGSQHVTKNSYDNARTAWLEGRGYRILRYWNVDVLFATDSVIDEIIRIAASRLQT